MTSARILVIGAGAAGLMAARELKRAGRRVIVLEAANRVGGRVLTLHNTNAGVPVELGAEFVHGDAPETTRLLEEARLVTYPVLGDHYRSDHGHLHRQDHAWTRVSRVFKSMNPSRKADRSFQEFLDDKPGGRALARERDFARGFIEGYFAADTTLISEKSLAQGGDPTEAPLESRRIVSGYSALIEHLQRDVARDIRLNVRVKRIIWGKSHVRVLDQTGREYRAQAAVITVPLPMLQDDSISLEPEIPMLRHAARQIAMGHVTRLGLVVKERFWERKADAIGYVFTPLRPFKVWWTQNPLQAPLITGWTGGPPAVQLAKSGDVESAAISELARAFGMQRSRAEALVDSIYMHDWMHDSNIRGAYSYARVGGSHAVRVLARSFGDRIFLAGEATDSGSTGTVEGAIATGKRAARKVLRRFAS